MTACVAVGILYGSARRANESGELIKYSTRGAITKRQLPVAEAAGSFNDFNSPRSIGRRRVPLISLSVICERNRNDARKSHFPRDKRADWHVVAVKSVSAANGRDRFYESDYLKHNRIR